MEMTADFERPVDLNEMRFFASLAQFEGTMESTGFACAENALPLSMAPTIFGSPGGAVNDRSGCLDFVAAVGVGCG